MTTNGDFDFENIPYKKIMARQLDLERQMERLSALGYPEGHPIHKKRYDEWEKLEWLANQ